MDRTTLIIILVVIPLAWAMFSLPFLYYIKAEGRKHYNKNLKVYPYLSYPFYKKIFLLGLQGAVNKFIIVLTFMINIITSLLIILGVVQLVFLNVYLDYILRAMLGVYWVLLLLKSILFAYNMPKL